MLVISQFSYGFKMLKAYRYPENSTTYCCVAEAQSAAGRIAAVLPHEAAVDDGPLAAWTG